MNYKNYFKKNLFEAISRELMEPKALPPFDYEPMSVPMDGRDERYLPYRDLLPIGDQYYHRWYDHYPEQYKYPAGWEIPPLPPNLLNKPIEEMTQEELALYHEFMRALYELWKTIRPYQAMPMPKKFWPFPTGVNPWIPIPYPEYYTNPDIMPPFTPPHPLGIDQPGGWGWDPYFEQWHYVWG